MIKATSVFQGKLLVIAVCSISIIFGACKKTIKTPAYIHIDSIGLSTDPLTQGSNSASIKDAWVTIDGTLIGDYEMPITLPALVSEGTHKVSIDAGILINGIAASRNNYPFYTSFVQETDLKQGATVTMTPTVTYTNNAFFAWKENFDNASFTIAKTSRCDAAINIVRVTGADAFESGSAYIAMAPGSFQFECAAVDEVGLPKDGSNIYLELNFKTNVPLTVGLITNAISGVYQESVEVLNPTDSWKKVYIYMTSQVQLHADAGGHKVFFGYRNDGSVANPQIYLDNIKLIY